MRDPRPHLLLSPAAAGERTHTLEQPAANPHKDAEFFRLAAVWLACRNELLNNGLTGDRWLFAFMGELDYSVEMHFWIEEQKCLA